MLFCIISSTTDQAILPAVEPLVRLDTQAHRYEDIIVALPEHYFQGDFLDLPEGQPVLGIYHPIQLATCTVSVQPASVRSPQVFRIYRN